MKMDESAQRSRSSFANLPRGSIFVPLTCKRPNFKLTPPFEAVWVIGGTQPSSSQGRSRAVIYFDDIGGLRP